MSKHHREELPSIDPTVLQHVTGGAGDMSSILPMMMMMRKKSAPPSIAAPPPAPPAPKILLNGVEQPASGMTGNASSFETTV